ncbi:MAG TPA: hypothetical protein VKO18_21170 [Terriglobia bacterium]|nr:hypothetical protein [Terriglobia bacterium]
MMGIAPDGRKYPLVKDRTSPVTHMSAVLNWNEELNRAAATNTQQ